MSKYKGFHRIDKIKTLCDEAGFHIDTSKWDNEGSDWVTISGVFDGQQRTFIYSGFNGRFIGKMAEEDTDTYSEESTKLDAVGWYIAIMDFLYIPAEAETKGAA